MSDFINTIDQLGDEVVTNLLIDRTITEFKDNVFIKLPLYFLVGCSKLETVSFPNVVVIDDYAFSDCTSLHTVDFPNTTEVGPYAFRNCTSLTAVNLPNATKFNGNAFYDCKSLTTINLPNATILGNSIFSNCQQLETVDLPKVTSILSSAFSSCWVLTAVILRNETTVTLSGTSAFNNCYHILGTVNATGNPTGAKDGYIYVPRALVDSYKTAPNWSTYATQFRALEDYTVDGTITGELDPTKI